MASTSQSTSGCWVEVRGGELGMMSSNTVTVLDGGDGRLSVAELTAANTSMTRAGRLFADLPFVTQLGSNEDAGAPTVADSDLSDNQAQTASLQQL